ncbi:hypothetical protein C9374_012134 [Naegleria lovaniensis]|uniref:Rho-GAP domain-containing protein n=1 Tax=Naegleria lovaniensis TaxID=51637 RepID=A0AA88G7V1_NAELO|nr:uncharacterized protein C9374_012134 [Naegleria lovaniensis]KAG2373395.1 hypothetical protein C9374_012134 [Naegleria lovaniensis]
MVGIKLKLTSAAESPSNSPSTPVLNTSSKKKKKKNNHKKKDNALDPSVPHLFGQSLNSQLHSIRTALLIQEDDPSCSGGKRFVVYPKLLWLCLNWLENNPECTNMEGIFRLSGQASLINSVKEQLSKGKYDNIPKLEDYDSDSDDDESFGTPTAEDEISKSNIRENKLIQKFLVYFYPSSVAPESISFGSLNKQPIVNNLIEIPEINFEELFPQNTINNVSSLLKMYIRELPEPLMTFDHYDMFIASDGIPDDNVRLQVIRNVLRFLPRSNYFILKKLCGFLHSVHVNSSVNKMDASNLAIVFAPNILRPPPMYCNVLQMQLSEARFATSLTQSLVTEYEFFFGAEDAKPKLEPQKTPTPPPNKPNRSISSATNNKAISMLSSTSYEMTHSNSSVSVSSSDSSSTNVFIPSNGNNGESPKPQNNSNRLTSPKPPPSGLRDSSRSVFVASSSNRSDTSTNVRSVIDNMNTLHTSKQAAAEIKRLSRVMKAGDICLDDQSLKSTTLSSFNDSTSQNKRLPVPPRRATVFTEATKPSQSTGPTNKNEMFVIPPRKVSPRKTTTTSHSNNMTFNSPPPPTKPPTPSRFAGASTTPKPSLAQVGAVGSTSTTSTPTLTSPRPLPPPKSSSLNSSTTNSSAATSSGNTTQHQDSPFAVPARTSLDDDKKSPGGLKNNPFIKQDVNFTTPSTSSSGATRAPPPVPRRNYNCESIP